MKKALMTASIFLAAGILLLFSFQRDKKAVRQPVKKPSLTAFKAPAKPEAKRPLEISAKVQGPSPVEKLAPQAASHSDEPEWNETLLAFFNEMPRATQMKNASAQEIHETPHAVLVAGEKLADIHEYFFNHPQPRDVEMTFYLKCSQQKDFFDSIRAVCAARLSQHYFEATGHQISSEIFDSNIDQLRREINL